MLYSKNGSIPKPQTDGTEGWVEVEDMPIAPEGKEVVWWCPPGWVVRDPKPAATKTTDWSWSQSEERWVEYTLPTIEEPVVLEISGMESATSDIASYATAGITIDMASATEITDGN